MSEGSRRSRVTITLGRSGQVVNRALSQVDAEYELPIVGTKRSVKERLGPQLDISSSYCESVSKRQRGEESFSGNDLQISKNDLRFKLMQKNAKKAHSDTIDLREKLNRSQQQHPSRSLDTRQPRNSPSPPLSLRTGRASSQILSPRNSSAPWSLDDIRRRSPERFISASRGLSPPRNGRSIIGTSRSPSPSRRIGTQRALSPPRSGGRIIGRALSPRMSAPSRAHSPPRNTRSFSNNRSRALSPPRIIGNQRAFSPDRNTRGYSSSSRAISPSRNVGSYMGSSSRRFSPVRDSRSYMGSPPPPRRGYTPRGLSPVRNPGSYMASSRGPPPSRSGYPPRGLSPVRNNPRSYMGGSPPHRSGSSRGFSPGRNPGSYVASSRGSPPQHRSIEGRSRMLVDGRPSISAVNSVLNGQATASGAASFPRPTMLPPPVPNPHPLPPLSQLGSMMQNNPFLVEEPLSVESFLDSLGLGRYAPTFRREEVDMNTIKQMKESDLKDMIIPMGPRKKLMEAIASLPKR